MLTRVILTCSLLAWTLAPSQKPCHFTVQLEVKGSGATKMARTSTPCLQPPEGRPVLEATAGEQITIHWTVTALAENASRFEDITVHSFVARETEIGQTLPIALDEAAVLETALLMDFSPKDVSTGAFEVVLDDPGSYLVRVETIGLVEKETHEHCAALDVRVVPAKEKRAERGEKKQTE